MKRLFLLLHTIRYLKLKQLFYRIYYRLRKPCVKSLPDPELRGVLRSWPGDTFLQPATEDGKTFTFLGETAELSNDWNSPVFSKLWLYNLHYQDDLNAQGAINRQELNTQLVDNWLAANPPLQGNGWEPYCLSLRLVNWVKFFSRLEPGDIKLSWLRSFAQQADVLEQQLEFHILANHLFANAKALVFAGAFLGGQQGDRLLQRGLRLLDEEIPEQFLADGAHYELSPMYTAALLWDLADLIALQKTTQLPELVKGSEDWRKRLQKGLEWLQVMTHPDGDLAFFNDSALGISPTLVDLQGYARKLNLEVLPERIHHQLYGDLLKASGYGVVCWPERHHLLIDVAQIGPDYQPGHAHADSLSCELSLFGQRVLVNSGISQYGEDAERHRQRSTAAHNTVEVDGENSSEVWAGFRVARRAKPFDVELIQDARQVLVKACHTGYQHLPGKVTHQRRWQALPHALLIEDELNGEFSRAVAHWHFHPAVRLELLADNRFKLLLSDDQYAIMTILGAQTSLLASSWHPRFGVAMINQKFELLFTENKVTTQIEWSPV